MKLIALVPALVSLASASAIRKRDVANGFVCETYWMGGCCTEYYTNPFDEYASGVGCKFAVEIPTAATTKEWYCPTSLTAGCCEIESGANPPIPWLCAKPLPTTFPVTVDPISSTTVASSTSTSTASPTTTPVVDVCGA